MPDNEDTRLHRTIIAGVDGSPAGARALRWAVSEAGRRGGEVHAITVRERDELLPGTSFAIQPHGRRPVADEATERAHLHSQVLAAGGEGVPVTETVVTGDPATELIKASADADLLVVGSHGHGPLSEVLLGSAAADCVRHAQCPVVLIPAASLR
ncbi:universal stress protein [Qaidamihabitans albus]|uniref:universal stress protein n=1 Tax=Qaidamihabitans albus TaxID=2795733 RepID=UPI0018F15329|nr:universal stress protein [Qaidamihabitans albus]